MTIDTSDLQSNNSGSPKDPSKKENKNKDDISIAESVIYEEYIDFILESKNFENKRFFDAIKDGIILEKLVKKIKFNCTFEKVKESTVNADKQHKQHYQTLQRVHSVLKYAKELGICVVNIEPWDIMRGNKILCLGLIWQLVRRAIIEKILLFNNNIAISDVKHAEQVLLDWINYAINEFKNKYYVAAIDYIKRAKDGKSYGLDFNNIMVSDKFENFHNYYALNSEVYTADTYFIIYMIYFNDIFSKEEVFKYIIESNEDQKNLGVKTLAGKINLDKYILVENIRKKEKSINFLFLALLMIKYNNRSLSSSTDLLDTIPSLVEEPVKEIEFSEENNEEVEEISKDDNKTENIENEEKSTTELNIIEEESEKISVKEDLTKSNIINEEIEMNETTNEINDKEENLEVVEKDLMINEKIESEKEEHFSSCDGDNENVDENLIEEKEKVEILDEEHEELPANDVKESSEISTGQKKVTFDDNSIVEEYYPVDSFEYEEKDSCTSSDDEELHLKDSADNIYCEIEISDDAHGDNKKDISPEKLLDSLNIQSAELSQVFKSLINEYVEEYDKKDFASMTKEDKEFLILKQVIKKAEEKLNIKFQNLESVPFNEAIMVIEKLIEHASFIHSESSALTEKEQEIPEIPQQKKKRRFFGCC